MAAQLIRVPVDGIRIAGRASKGVRIFNTAEDEKVVSVERIGEPEEEEADEDGDGAEAGPVPQADDTAGEQHDDTNGEADGEASGEAEGWQGPRRAPHKRGLT